MLTGSRELKKPARFFIDKLGLDAYPIAIHVRIDTLTHLHGYCSELSDFEYEIGINVDLAENPLETLAHEMVHVFQYASGQMSDLALDKVLWRDKVYSQPEDEESEEYWELPWEVDARNQQGPLAMSYILETMR